MTTSALPLPVSTRVVAVRNFGPITEGQPGIITGIAEQRFFWRSKLVYLCTFADGVKAAAKPNEIDNFDHGYTLAELENPDFLTARAARDRDELKTRLR